MGRSFSVSCIQCYEARWNTSLAFFDSCEFTLSLMIQKPEKGGIFEYCPNIRKPGNENFDEVKVLEGDRTRELNNYSLNQVICKYLKADLLCTG